MITRGLLASSRSVSLLWKQGSLTLSRAQLSTTLKVLNDAPQEEAESKAVGDLEQEIKELKDELEKQKESSSDFKDKYLRSLAEGENTRLRMTKQIEDAKLFGIQSFCKDLLTVADTMDMAVKCISEEKLSETDDSVWKSFHEGVEMTYKDLHKVFERNGCQVLSPQVGDKFDPNLHEALFQVPSADLEPQSVAHVEQIGYRLKGRTLRAAKVGVSKKVD